MRVTEGEAGTQKRLSIDELRRLVLVNSLLVARYHWPWVLVAFWEISVKQGHDFVSAPEGSTSNPLYMYLQEESKTASLVVEHTCAR